MNTPSVIGETVVHSPRFSKSGGSSPFPPSSPWGGAQRSPLGEAGVSAVPPLGISGHIPTDPKVNRCHVSLYPRGVRTFVPCPVKANKPWNGCKRSFISTFSAKSRARLRSVLLSKDGPPDWYMSALTLTVPGDEIMPVQEFQRLFSHWSISALRLGVLIIWRVELQQRGMPHVHAVCWAECPEISAEAGRLWFQLLSGYETRQSDEKGGGVILRSDVRGAWEHAVKVDHGGMSYDPHKMGGWSFTGIGQGWWRYLCDHTSKKKQAQLGWTGRHWGIIGRRLLRENAYVHHDLSERQYTLFSRYLRRLTRSWKWRGSKGTSTWFTSPETASRLLEWAVKTRP